MEIQTETKWGSQIVKNIGEILVKWTWKLDPGVGCRTNAAPGGGSSDTGRRAKGERAKGLGDGTAALRGVRWSTKFALLLKQAAVPQVYKNQMYDVYHEEAFRRFWISKLICLDFFGNFLEFFGTFLDFFGFFLDFFGKFWGFFGIFFENIWTFLEFFWNFLLRCEEFVGSPSSPCCYKTGCVAPQV